MDDIDRALEDMNRRIVEDVCAIMSIPPMMCGATAPLKENRPLARRTWRPKRELTPEELIRFIQSRRKTEE